jgi:hypothetical protein
MWIDWSRPFELGLAKAMLRQSGITSPGTDIVTFYRARHGS